MTNSQQVLIDYVADSEMEVIAHVIDKRLITGVAAEQFTHPAYDPYYVALRMALFSLFGILRQQQQGGRVTHIIAEARGKFEDRLLKSDLNRHLEELKKFSFGEGRDFHNFPIELLFAEKKSNSAGLQLADLIGHPIGRNYLNPEQKNHAFEIVRTKLYGRIGNITIIQESERPQISLRPSADRELPVHLQTLYS